MVFIKLVHNLTDIKNQRGCFCVEHGVDIFTACCIALLAMQSTVLATVSLYVCLIHAGTTCMSKVMWTCDLDSPLQASCHNFGLLLKPVVPN